MKILEIYQIFRFKNKFVKIIVINSKNKIHKILKIHKIQWIIKNMTMKQLFY